MVLDCKTVWLCWFDGEDDPNLPEIERNCISRWKSLNSDRDVVVITDQNINDYCPEYVDIVSKYQHSYPRSKTNKSELLRVLLLEKFGGIWADASVFPTAPMNMFEESFLNNGDFFTYRFFPIIEDSNQGDRTTVSWFMIVRKPKLKLFEKLKQEITRRYLDNNVYKYFTVHDIISEMYKNDNHVKHIVDNMLQLDEKIPHSAQRLGMQKQSDWIQSYMYKRPPLAYINAA